MRYDQKRQNLLEDLQEASEIIDSMIKTLEDYDFATTKESYKYLMAYVKNVGIILHSVKIK